MQAQLKSLPNFPLGRAASRRIFHLETETTWIPTLRTEPPIHQSFKANYIDEWQQYLSYPEESKNVLTDRTLRLPDKAPPLPSSPNYGLLTRV